jgi:hypothetical protein
VNIPGPDTFALALSEATVSLYPANGDGSPATTQPIWSGLSAENFSAREKWIKHETRPSGAAYPRKHPLVAQYEISIERVWGFQMENAAGFVTNSGYYVLDVLWTDEQTGYWHRETFYNVTISERSRRNQEIDRGFMDEQMFEAEYMSPPSGGPGTPPAISNQLPYTVVYVPAQGAALTQVIYTYDPTSHNFTEAIAGISAGTAVLAYNPSNKSGTFTVTFAGAGSPALEVMSTGALDETNCVQGMPDNSQVPRLDFYYGLKWCGSITASGTLYGSSFDDGTPSAGSGLFELFGGSALAVTMSPVAIQADNYN